MKTMWSDQFKKSCVVVELGDTLDEIIAKANDEGAFYFDGEDECFVIDFRDNPDRQVGPELYTEEALRRSFPKREDKQPIWDALNNSDA